VNDLVVIAASAVTVAILSGIAAALGFRVRGRFADEAAVRAAILHLDPQAKVADLAIDGGWALARLSDGGLVVARALGHGATARRLPAVPQVLRVKPDRRGVRILVAGLDFGFPGGALRLPECPPWLDAHVEGR